MQRTLLILLTCLYSTALFAQLNVNVEISGVDRPLEDNIRLHLSIEQQKDHLLMTEGRLRRLHKKALQDIPSALHPFGYYRPKIDPQLSKIAPDQWLASYTIDPGPPLPIKKLDFVLSGEIINDPEFLSLTTTLPLKEGATFDHRHYERSKSALANLATEKGYFDAIFSEHRVEINLDTYDASIHLHYNGGRRYRFGEILLQQDVLDPQLLQSYIPFRRGEPYTLDELLTLKQALNDSDYFQSVEISPDQPQANSIEIPITISLSPRKKNRYSFGAGYGTDTGSRIKLSWEAPRLNRYGHRVSAEAKISEIGYSVSTQYRVPIFNPRTDQMVYSAGVVNEKTDSSNSTLRTIGASLNRSHERWRESASLSYQQEEYVIANDRNTSNLLIPSINWNRTWGQNFIYTLDGLRFDIGLRGASTKLISDTNFFQLQGGIKAINSLGRRNRIIARGRLGSTWMDEFQELPSSVRFFAGGAQSVRGYAYRSLGPINNTGQLIGGKHLMVGSIEFEHSLSGKWGLALFYDGGNAIDNFTDKLERGAGIGLRWQSPVGSVRIDIASAVSRDDQPWRLHINIGPDL